MRQGFKLVDKKKETAYDLPSSSSSVSSFSSFNDGKMLHQLKVNEQAVLIKVTQYYFGDNQNHFVSATQKNLTELFPKCEQQVTKFCRKNKINFTKKSDLERVVSFFTDDCR